ncbi:MAG TPA: STAS domain-containing protein, partial [Smithellaceae bacterium]|nr:STAS domain-containing protein [Smithellaceae bacterium]
METGSVYYARHENTYVIKLIGEVRYQLGCAFDDFLKRLFAKDDFRDIVIDLTETRMIDSTCLGLLAKIANYARAHFGGKVTM